MICVTGSFHAAVSSDVRETPRIRFRRQGVEDHKNVSERALGLHKSEMSTGRRR